MDKPTKCDLDFASLSFNDLVMDAMNRWFAMSKESLDQLLMDNYSRTDDIKQKHLNKMCYAVNNARAVVRDDWKIEGPAILTSSPSSSDNDSVSSNTSICQFCKKNNEIYSVYTSHDKTCCPILAAYKCPICHENGHTVKYCLLSNDNQKTMPPRRLANGSVVYSHNRLVCIFWVCLKASPSQEKQV